MNDIGVKLGIFNGPSSNENDSNISSASFMSMTLWISWQNLLCSMLCSHINPMSERKNIEYSFLFYIIIVQMDRLPVKVKHSHSIWIANELNYRNYVVFSMWNDHFNSRSCISKQQHPWIRTRTKLAWNFLSKKERHYCRVNRFFFFTGAVNLLDQNFFAVIQIKSTIAINRKIRIEMKNTQRDRERDRENQMDN